MIIQFVLLTQTYLKEYLNNKGQIFLNASVEKIYKKENKISVLLASHNMSEVKRLCDSILMMKDGIIIDKGKPDELINKHGRQNLEEVFLKLARNKNEL